MAPFNFHWYSLFSLVHGLEGPIIPLRRRIFTASRFSESWSLDLFDLSLTRLPLRRDSPGDKTKAAQKLFPERLSYCFSCQTQDASKQLGSLLGSTTTRHCNQFISSFGISEFASREFLSLHAANPIVGNRTPTNKGWVLWICIQCKHVRYYHTFYILNLSTLPPRYWLASVFFPVS